MFFVPRSVIILISMLLAVHLLRTLIVPEWDQFTVVMLGILPGRYQPGVISSFPGGVWAPCPPS